MRTAFVLGFFEPVRKALIEAFPAHINDGSIVWVPQMGPMRAANLNDFKSKFFDKVTSGVTHAIVILAILRKEEWVEDQVRGILESGKFRAPGLEVDLVCERNATAAEFVLQQIRTFAPTAAMGITLECLRERLRTNRILCVRESQCAGFRDALQKNGFPDEAWDEFFTEVQYDSGTRPEVLSEKASGRSFVLYAFDRFPHAFGQCLKQNTDQRRVFTGRLAREAVLQLKKWLLEVP